MPTGRWPRSWSWSWSPSPVPAGGFPARELRAREEGGAGPERRRPRRRLRERVHGARDRGALPGLRGDGRGARAPIETTGLSLRLGRRRWSGSRSGSRRAGSCLRSARTGPASRRSCKSCSARSGRRGRAASASERQPVELARAIKVVGGSLITALPIIPAAASPFPCRRLWRGLGPSGCLRHAEGPTVGCLLDGIFGRAGAPPPPPPPGRAARTARGGPPIGRRRRGAPSRPRTGAGRRRPEWCRAGRHRGRWRSAR